MSGGTPTIGAAEYRRIMGLDQPEKAAQAGNPPQGRSAPGPIAGRARRPRPGRNYDTEAMNRTEAAYAAHLDALLAAGAILAWKYEGHKFKLGDRTWYTPDFEVIRADGGIEMHEVKGFWEDDARVKIKAAASQYRWYRFLAVKAGRGGAWDVERFGLDKEAIRESPARDATTAARWRAGRATGPGCGAASKEWAGPWTGTSTGVRPAPRRGGRGWTGKREEETRRNRSYDYNDKKRMG